MINAERLQDAIGLLPEELLAPVDALRRRQPTVWKKAAAAAAGILLVIGLWQLRPLEKAGDSNGALMEDFNGVTMEGLHGAAPEDQFSTAYACSLPAVVTETGKAHLTVTLSDGKTATVYFDNLQTQRTFLPGEEITLLFAETPKDFLQLYPDEIVTK